MYAKNAPKPLALFTINPTSCYDPAMTIHVVLFEPEIPPNTGNIIRLCANTGAQLHLIHPLGFSLAEKPLRRAGLDYKEWVNVKEHQNWQTFLDTENPTRIFACTTKTTNHHTDANYQDNDVLLFGPETRGLPDDIRNSIDASTHIRIPMRKESRSMNLSNSVSVILYEALRQLGFPELI